MMRDLLQGHAKPAPIIFAQEVVCVLLVFQIPGEILPYKILFFFHFS